MAPLRILRDFEARTFGPPPSLHNLLPLAVPASATSSPRSLPQSPLAHSRPTSAAALTSHRSATAIAWLSCLRPMFCMPQHACPNSTDMNLFWEADFLTLLISLSGFVLLRQNCMHMQGGLQQSTSSACMHAELPVPSDLLASPSSFSVCNSAHEVPAQGLAGLLIFTVLTVLLVSGQESYHLRTLIFQHTPVLSPPAPTPLPSPPTIPPPRHSSTAPFPSRSS